VGGVGGWAGSLETDRLISTARNAHMLGAMCCYRKPTQTGHARVYRIGLDLQVYRYLASVCVD